MKNKMKIVSLLELKLKSGSHLVIQFNTSSHYFESFTDGILVILLFGLVSLKAT